MLRARTIIRNKMVIAFTGGFWQFLHVDTCDDWNCTKERLYFVLLKGKIICVIF